MKANYSTPRLEVVVFSPADAPRIGMQWWYQHATAGWSQTPAGWSPANLASQPWGVGIDFTQLGIQCSSVDTYYCHGENLPAADLVEDYQSGGQAHYVVNDGLGSC